MANDNDQFQPGQRVVVVQQIPQREIVWTTRLVGTVLSYEQRKTGSWFARTKDDKLWLDRLTLRQDDGEMVVCNLDNYTHVEVVADASASAEVEASMGERDTPRPVAS